MVRPRGCPFHFGRVIRNDVSFFGPNVLSYTYAATSHDKAEIANLSRTALLIPPIVTSTEPWTRGYFEVVGSSELRECDVLEQHCFRVGKTDVYTDEDRNRLPGPIEPVGQRAMMLPIGVDRMVSDALGLSVRTTRPESVPIESGSNTSPPGDGGDDQHLLVHINPWTDDDKNVPLDLMDVEENLLHALSSRDSDHYSGHGLDSHGGVDLFLYGPSCDARFAAIAPVLAKWDLSGFAVKRYGRPGAREEHNDWP